MSSNVATTDEHGYLFLKHVRVDDGLETLCGMDIPPQTRDPHPSVPSCYVCRMMKAELRQG